jgi:dUTP pyrophosphatase
MELLIKRLPHAVGLPLPSYATDGAAGLDMRAAIPESAVWWLAPGESTKIPTGFCIAVPDGNVGLFCARSGLAASCQVSIVNSPGLVDSDYRGECFALLENRGEKPFSVERGDRIGQLLILSYPTISFREVDELPFSKRGAQGFGSTGR